MSIKLITTDLDGTLMSPDHLTVTDRTITALKNAHNKGIKIAIATGRPMSIIGNVIDQIPFVDYVIQSNGACVYDRNENKNIYENLIPFDTVKKLIEYFLQKDIYFDVSYQGESHYQLGTEEHFSSTFLPSDFIEEVMKTMKGHNGLAEFLNGNGVEKFTLYDIDKEDFDKFKEILLSFKLCVSSSIRDSLEATEINTNKGTAVAGICEAIGITANEVMTFGDAGNDCPMLEFAEYSFAMGNATEECKKSAKFIAKSNAEDGLALEVEKYCL